MSDDTFADYRARPGINWSRLKLARGSVAPKVGLTRIGAPLTHPSTPSLPEVQEILP